MSAEAERVIARMELYRGCQPLERLYFTGNDVCALVDEVYRLRNYLAQTWELALSAEQPAQHQPTQPQLCGELAPRATIGGVAA